MSSLKSTDRGDGKCVVTGNLLHESYKEYVTSGEMSSLKIKVAGDNVCESNTYEYKVCWLRLVRLNYPRGSVWSSRAR